MDSVNGSVNMQEAIEIEKEKIRRKYRDSAEEIVSGYNKECELSKDYEGRQMFELLQNADDEAAGSSGKVRVTFDGKTLSVSNTGEPFSFRGVKSLLYPYASPKKIHANKIGCKGLGFRSILTWAKSVTVASKDFTIQFSREYAKAFLQSILEEKPRLREEIKTLTNEPWPIATLTCPKVLTKSVLEDGFYTSIIMECREDLADVIEEQIISLQFEELIFLPNLKEIEIICNDYHRKFYKVVEGDEVIIETRNFADDTIKCASWKLYRRTGIIKDENGNDKTYEFIIAYDSSGEQHGEVLYSYFKTDVKLGFPALIHGTFELTSDRNSLQKQSQVNKQLVPLLAGFMVQTAVKISEEQAECDYKPLSLVITSDMDIVLKDIYKLDQLLRNEVHEKSILPTIGNKYISINDAPKYTAVSFADVLNPQMFPELLKPTGDEFIEDYLESDLDIEFYSYEEFCNLLNNSISDYSMEEKAELISLIKNKFQWTSSPRVFPHLLVDSNGENICDGAKVYPLPNEEQVIDLPRWVDIKFLSPELEHLLYKKLGIHSVRRELVAVLSKYNMEEYSFEKLLRSVVNQFDDLLVSADKCSDVLNWLWKYYNQEGRQPISDVRVKVICRDGAIRYARECYIGTEYGNSLGERLIQLYSQNFVALKELKIDCEDVTGITGFLEWIGAAKYPRIVKKTLSTEERKSFLKICYPLYVQGDNCWYDSYEFSNIHEVSVGSIENLEQVIAGANFNDLLAWFVLDSDVNQRIYADTEKNNSFSCITGWPGYKQNPRKVTPTHIKSYLRYYLSTVKWIPDDQGNKEIPEYCCFEDNLLAPFIIVPKIDYGYIQTEVGRNCRKDIDAILSRIGVADVFQEMKNTVVYQALMKLPELDLKCKLGRSIYRKIIREGFTPEEYKKENPDYDAFIKNGMVLAKQNGTKKYVPVSQARYADKKVFSEDILGSFNMFDIDARSGEEKIKKLFGVQPLKYINVETDGEPVLHLLDEAFKKEYQRFIPFVFACRSGLKNAKTDFRRLKSSKVILCSSITIRYMFRTESRVSALKEYETVYLRKGNTAYICLSRKFTDFAILKQNFEFADAVAELITEMLDVNEDKDFFRDLFRESDFVREKKMRIDKGDENLELLMDAKRRFNSEINLRDEFWMTLADIVHVSNVEINSSTANELIAAMQLPANIDAGISYEVLNAFENMPILSGIFRKLGIDIVQYNASANHTLDVSPYWGFMLKNKMKRYRPRYQAYLIDKLDGEDNAVVQYDQYIEEYDYLEPTIENLFSVDLDAVFAVECGVKFDKLDSYSDEKAAEIMATERGKISDEDWGKLKTAHSPTKIETYLILGRIDELLNPADESQEEKNNLEQSEPQNIKNLASEVFGTPAQGFCAIEMQTVKNNAEKSESMKHKKHQKKTHSDLSDWKKQEIGIVGEVCVYKELLALYPDARWVSGNAEKAGHATKGDDTCGYDIKYTDESGMIQYVEVKASRNEDITFLLSDSELRFGCKNAANYEIIYVVVGEDGKPAHQPWRLGHIFDFVEGEDLFHNNRFSIESDSYRVVAQPIGTNDSNIVSNLE
ncbi:MAG: DUF3883 domain-containing protein [Lachnospiraceae bacterium]|nr:DUF3883 domain-containing protein [Lachnospiraceae bacterium]